MLFTIRSTRELILEDEETPKYDALISRALDNSHALVRESYTRDNKGWRTRIAVAAYSTPAGEPRWVIAYTSRDEPDEEVEWRDTDDLDEALAEYEDMVRWKTDHLDIRTVQDGDLALWAMHRLDATLAETGTEYRWDYSDVDSVPARVQQPTAKANRKAYLLNAVRAHEELALIEAAYQRRTRQRQMAFAKLDEAWGHGGQVHLALRTDLKPPTVNRLVERGRALLAAPKDAPQEEREV
ncbi:hypothetical protein [Streptomyces sp. NPDC088925]|uniref:hypothetical protein n=1 Tax=Streptomyces sp. NPDC088925 TaxID=3365914 RepID=UPI00382AC758